MKKNFLLLAILALNILPSFAQKASEQVTRRMNLAILNTLDEYERVVSLVDINDKKAFVRLFENANVPCIYNDLIGVMSYQQTVTPTEYTNCVPTDGSFMVSISLSDVEKSGEPFYADGKLHRKLSLTKSVMLIDSGTYSIGAGGVLFDSHSFYKDDPDFRLVFDFTFDEESGKCKISSISATPKSRSVIDGSHFTVVVKSNDKKNMEQKYFGESLAYNDFNQAIVDLSTAGDNTADIIAEKTIIAKNDHYDVVTMKFVPIRGRLKIRGGYSPDAYSLSSTIEGLSHSSRSAEFSLDLGYAIPASDIFRLGLYAGAGFSYSSISLALNECNYTCRFTSPYSAPESREYSFSATESLSFMDIFVPLYLEGEFYPLKRLLISLDLGTKLYMNTRTILGPYHINGIFSGTAVDRDFGAFIAPARYGRNPFDASIFGSLGIEYGFSAKSFIFVSAGYEYGLTTSYNGSSIYLNEAKSIYPFVYSANEHNDVAYRSLIGTTTYKRQGLIISLGFKFKF